MDGASGLTPCSLGLLHLILCFGSGSDLVYVWEAQAGESVAAAIGDVCCERRCLYSGCCASDCRGAWTPADGAPLTVGKTLFMQMLAGEASSMHRSPRTYVSCPLALPLLLHWSWTFSCSVMAALFLVWRRADHTSSLVPSKKLCELRMRSCKRCVSTRAPQPFVQGGSTSPSTCARGARCGTTGTAGASSTWRARSPWWIRLTSTSPNLTVRETLEFAYICQVRKACCGRCPADVHHIWNMPRPA